MFKIGGSAVTLVGPMYSPDTDSLRFVNPDNVSGTINTSGIMMSPFAPKVLHFAAGGAHGAGTAQQADCATGVYEGSATER